MIPANSDEIGFDDKSERGHRSSFVFWLPITMLIAVDQAIKYLSVHGKIKFQWDISGLIIKEENFRNYFFAFSVKLPEFLIFFIYGIVLFLIFNYVAERYQLLSKIELAAWVLIVAGALSNIGERLVLGYVRDFIYIATGIFNVADFYIILGVILLVIKIGTKKI